MIFGHERLHEPSALHAPPGPTPLWVKLCCASSMLAVAAIIGHSIINKVTW